MDDITSRTKHSSSSEDNTGRFACWSGHREAETNDSALLLSPHICECDEPKCFSASQALTQKKKKNRVQFFRFYLAAAFLRVGRPLTSAVRVIGCYRVKTARLEVKQETSVSIVSLPAHQSVENHLDTQSHVDFKPLTPACVCGSYQPDCDALWSLTLVQFSAPGAEFCPLLVRGSRFGASGFEHVSSRRFFLSDQTVATTRSLLYLPAL